MSTSQSRAREVAVQRQAGICFYCETPVVTRCIDRALVAKAGLSPRQAKRLQCTAEHLVPRSCGGDCDRSNIVAACLFCNQTRHRCKKVRSPEQYARHVRNRIAAGRWHPPEVVRAARILRRLAAA